MSAPLLAVAVNVIASIEVRYDAVIAGPEPLTEVDLSSWKIPDGPVIVVDEAVPWVDYYEAGYRNGQLRAEQLLPYLAVKEAVA